MISAQDLTEEVFDCVMLEKPFYKDNFTKSAQLRQSKPDFGLDFEGKVLKTCKCVPFSRRI